jgi:hypothetical protein
MSELDDLKHRVRQLEVRMPRQEGLMARPVLTCSLHITPDDRTAVVACFSDGDVVFETNFVDLIRTELRTMEKSEKVDQLNLLQSIIDDLRAEVG